MGVSKKGRRNSAGRIRKKKNYVHHSPNWSAKCKDAHTPPSCFIDSCISGHVWWGFVFFHLCSITPTPTTCAQAGTHVDTHSCVSMCYPPPHTHPAAYNLPLRPYPVDLSSFKNYRQRIYSFGRIPGTTLTFSSNEMGSRLCKLCCFADKTQRRDLVVWRHGLLFLSHFKLAWEGS